jgi:Protein of unknown function (DUF3800)
MIRCYLDESGTHESSPTAVVGGLLLSDENFFWLDVVWRKILASHGVTPPVHMREFGPYGRFENISDAARESLLTDLVLAINRYKTISIAATLTTEQYWKAFADIKVERGKAFSVYGACFVLLAYMNGVQAKDQRYSPLIPFVLDCGNAFKYQIVGAHAAMLRIQETTPYNVGCLGFDNDERLAALQAADVVSWSVRRRLSGQFNNGFDPLPGLFDDNHVEQIYEEAWMMQVASALRCVSPEPPTARIAR